jgi:hypothetical protein
MMFNETTDIFNGSWPYSAQKKFDDCDENRDLTLNTTEVEKCYERRCVEECTLQETREYREYINDTWCQCRTVSFDIIIEQFDRDDNSEISFAEFDDIYTNDTDTHNVDFSRATTTRTYFFTEAAAGSTDAGYCTEQKTVTAADGTT